MVLSVIDYFHLETAMFPDGNLAVVLALIIQFGLQAIML